MLYVRGHLDPVECKIETEHEMVGVVLNKLEKKLHIYLVFQEYEEPVYSYSTYPDRRYSSSTSQHFKMSPLFACSEGVSGYRYQSDGAHRTQPPRHCLSAR